MSVGSLRLRYLAVLALRWTSLGLLLPIFVLIMERRGLGLGEIGVALAMQGVVALILEVPAGVLADRWGQRRALLIGSVLRVIALAMLLGADSVATFGVVWALEGASRAFDSGSLDSWYVIASGPDRRGSEVRDTLARGGTVIGISVAAGSILTALLTFVGSPGQLWYPVAVAAGLQVVHLISVFALVRETDRRRTRGRKAGGSRRNAVAAVVLAEVALPLLIVSELLWGFGMTGVEVLWQPHLVGNTAAAAQGPLLGVVSTGAWILSAAGAAVLPRLLRWMPDSWLVASLMRVLQAAAIGMFAAELGVPLLIVAYGMVYLTHGASNPLHLSLLHERCADRHRSTVVSVNSFAAQIAGTIGTVTLPAVAGAWSITVSLVLSAAIVALSAILYPWARQRTRRTFGSGAAPVVPAADD